MNTQHATPPQREDLKQRALAAFQAKREEAARDIRDFRQMTVRAAYAELVSVFPELSTAEGGEDLELCGERFAAVVRLVGSPRFCLVGWVSNKCFEIYDLASYGEYLEAKQQQEQWFGKRPLQDRSFRWKKLFGR